MVEQEGGEVAGMVEMAEGLGEGLGTKLGKGGGIVRTGHTEGDGHATNPAGSGQSGDRIAMTLNSSPISSRPQSRCSACSTSWRLSGLLAMRLCARCPM